MGGRGGSIGLSYQGNNGGSGRAASNGVNVSQMKSQLSSLPEKVVNNRLVSEAVEQINRIKNANSDVKIYRATIGDSINQNDWIFLSRAQVERWTKTALGRPKPGTKHFKGFSIVQGDIKINVSLSRFEKQFEDAQKALDIAVMNSMLPFMPHHGTGNFIQRTQAESTAMAGTGIVCAAVGPYGRFLYEGKTMVDILTGSTWERKDAKKVLVSQYSGKTNAKEDLTYSRPSAVPHWFDEAKKRDLKTWVQTVKRTAGGGKRGR